MATVDEKDIEEQRRLAAKWEADKEGPLVGEILPSDKITEAYKDADEVFVNKTKNLPKTFAGFRPLRGDGSCGYRAILFGYFESLISGASDDEIKSKLTSEKERISRTEEELLKKYFPHSFTYEDYLEAMGELSDQLIKAEGDKARKEALMAAFGSEEQSLYLIQFLRILTGVHLRENAAQYEVWLATPGDTISNYCQGSVEPVNAEMDHLGFRAAYDVLIEGAGLAIDIYYLDRSAGEEINHHRFEAMDEKGQPKAKEGEELRTIYLLYRPGHYDIIYKDIPQ